MHKLLMTRVFKQALKPSILMAALASTLLVPAGPIVPPSLNPDLTGSSSSVSPTNSVYPGATLTIKLTVTASQSEKAAGKFVVRFFWHKDTESYAEADQILSREIAGLPLPGLPRQVFLSETWTIPPCTLAGAHKLTYWIDALGQVSEPNENNNRGTVTVPIGDASPFTVSAGPPQMVSWYRWVTLQGSVTWTCPSALGSLTYSWIQIPCPGLATTGVDVGLGEAHSLTAFFAAPPQDVTLHFRLIVSDAAGHAASNEVRVVVIERPENALYVSAAHGNDTNPGGFSSPVKTLEKALLLANARPESADSPVVCVEAGVYPDPPAAARRPLTVTKPVRLYGGFAFSSLGPWSRTVELSTINGPSTAIVIDVPLPADPWFTGMDYVLIDGFEIHSADGPNGDVTRGDGGNSACLHVKQGRLVATHNVLKPGRGGSGTNGAPGTDGVRGGTGEPAIEGNVNGTGMGGTSAVGLYGGVGGLGGGGKAVAEFFASLKQFGIGELLSGIQAALDRIRQDGLSGYDGKPGWGQIEGGKGGPATWVPDLPDALWKCLGMDGTNSPAWDSRAADGSLGKGGQATTCGENGTKGGDGRGGNGGGGGGAYFEVNFHFFPFFHPTYRVALGGAGGGGGAGGQGGGGGQGGFAGGSSYGVLVDDDGSAPQITANRIFLNAGGGAGDGGAGGPGANGTFGRMGAGPIKMSGSMFEDIDEEDLPSLAGKGASGQSGQNGGNGGRGGGGGGGHSYGVYFDSPGLIDGRQSDSNQYELLGAPGQGGQGEGELGHGQPGTQANWDVAGSPKSPRLEWLEFVRELPKLESALERLQLGPDIAALSVDVQWQGIPVLTRIIPPPGPAPVVRSFQAVGVSHFDFSVPGAGEWQVSMQRAAGLLASQAMETVGNNHGDAGTVLQTIPRITGSQVRIKVGMLHNRRPVVVAQDITVMAGDDGLADAWVDAGSSDPDPGDRIEVRQIPPGPYPVGKTVVKLEVEDRLGFVSSRQATVTVRDGTPPWLDAPEAVFVRADANGQGIATIPVHAWDNADPNPSVAVGGQAVYPAGVTDVAVQATDASGNVTRRTVQVLVFAEPRPEGFQIKQYGFGEGTYEPFAPQTGVWSVQHGQFVQQSAQGASSAVLDVGRFQEYAISLVFTQVQGEYTTVFFARSDQGGHYRVDFGVHECRLTLPGAGQPWESRALIVGGLDIAVGQPHEATVLIGREAVRVYLDNTLIHDQPWLNGVPLGDGRIGLGTLNAVAQFDDVLIACDVQHASGLKREVYLDLAGWGMDDLKNAAKFPNAPDVVDAVSTFESLYLPGNADEFYGQRLSGWLVPPQSGAYVFYLASDDQAEVYLSTDETAAGRRLIVWEPSWNDWRNWEGTAEHPQRKSEPIALVAGQSYWVEVLHKEGNGEDHVAVGWKLPGGAAPKNGDPPIGGEYLVTMQALTQPPRVLSAGAISGSMRVGLQFDEGLEAASAQIPGNYTVRGATVSEAILHGGRMVELRLLQRLSAAPTVTVRNVKDRAGNALGVQSVVSELSALRSQDIGTPGVDPVLAGYGVYAGGGGYLVAGGGHDIWDMADGFHYVFQEVRGPFDLRGRVEWMKGKSGLAHSSEWAKAELMVRESLGAGSRFVAQMATRSDGVNMIGPQWRDGTGGECAWLPTLSGVPYPDAWLRLVREDATQNVFKVYHSTDGVNWVGEYEHGVPGEAWPATVLVGIAVTSHDNSAEEPLAEAIVQSYSVQPWPPADARQLRVSLKEGQVVISWTAGTLVMSPTVTGPYTPVAGATSPYTVLPKADARFYQVAGP